MLTSSARRPDVFQKRREYIERQKSLPVPSLLFLDEFGVQPGMNRLYGGSVCGQPPVTTRQLRAKRLNAVGVLASNGPRALMSYTGSMNEARMLEFVGDHLGPPSRRATRSWWTGCGCTP